MIQRVGLVVLSILCIAAGPKLVITEIMFDPLSPESDERQTEWVEIHNESSQSVNMQGYQLTSGTKVSPHAAQQRYTFRDLSIAPGEYIVIGIGSGACYGGLGLPKVAAYCDEAKYAWLTNTGDSIAIRDAKNNIIDEVVYSSEAPWPAASRVGGSIQFLAPEGEDPAKANDEAKNWVASGVSNSEEFPGHGRGTPGKPPMTATTQPAKKK